MTQAMEGFKESISENTIFDLCNTNREMIKLKLRSKHDEFTICILLALKAHLFALYSRRILLRSIVCGKEPVVVVGRMGRFSFFCCESSLEVTGVARRWSEPLRAYAYSL